MKGFVLSAVVLMVGCLPGAMAAGDFSSAEWIGRLGKPFGSALEITGVPALEAVREPSPALNIGSVDGKALAQPVQMSIRFLNEKDARLLSQLGGDYTLSGYEAGEFVATPDWVPATRPWGPFHFHSVFVVVKVVGTKPLSFR